MYSLSTTFISISSIDILQEINTVVDMYLKNFKLFDPIAYFS